MTAPFFMSDLYSRRCGLAALAKSALSTDISYSSNDGAKRGSQANTLSIRRKRVTL